jgi:alpha-2-macroglobulin
VPDSAFDLALDWLESTQNLNTGQEVFGANLTYTLYLLAREGRRPASEARYLQDTHLAQLDAASRVQLAGALALSGETGRVASLLQATDLPVREWDDSDYGSTVRDGALRLTRMIELGADPGRIARLSDELASAVAGDRWLSTQEKAWLTLAAKAMIERQETVSVAMGGQSRAASAKPVTAFPGVSALTDGYVIENLGDKPVRISVAISGRASGPLPAIRNGFGIERTLYALDGTPVAPDAPLKRGARYMVLIDGTTESSEQQQAMVIDLLPAGLEIENTRLVAGGSLQDFGWLGELTPTGTTEFRDDRFVAAVDLNAERGQFRVAYLVRAVTPGTFIQPATQVEDMYRPERLARTALSRVTVAE